MASFVLVGLFVDGHQGQLASLDGIMQEKTTFHRQERG